MPVEITGLLVAGRCLSATHDAHASVRSMAQCVATGQAAGIAAALAADNDLDVSDISIPDLQRVLKTEGVIL